ncbi:MULTISPECIES: hypothetical protein [unclassified Micromonospora]|uniref:hypothetical protein n=1 Tax=unclassified Micromonospora TaxID=2617518 RepID=UPI00103408DE|nr:MULTISPECIES: hypothetical protein [unclassified Micromonospora]QKW12022.1 hypothetical protein HUT12_03930 [Verrucosispora sp. NA02020]TBL30684.1 hypothetical protein EYA84_22225 [Verrucosispora sp. SN26_14.1]
MRYDQLETAIRRLVDTAGEDELRVFGVETVARLVRDEGLVDVAADGELDEDAAAAFALARKTVGTADAATSRALITRIEEGALTDGDMDPDLLIALIALEHWTTYLETGQRDELYELALRSVEEVDHQVSADLDDFLATPEMAAEYERIARLLQGGPPA